MKKKITTKMIMEKNPCSDWTEERVKKVIGRGKTLLKLADLNIDIPDRIWVITRFLTDDKNRKFAIWCARSCKSKIPEINAYIDVIEKYYKGLATQEELDLAYRAADRAADWAAYSAAYWAAYWAADSAAYWAADNAAYWAARDNQITQLKKIIQEA